MSGMGMGKNFFWWGGHILASCGKRGELLGEVGDGQLLHGLHGQHLQVEVEGVDQLAWLMLLVQ